MFAWYERSTVCFVFLPEMIVLQSTREQDRDETTQAKCEITGHDDVTVSEGGMTPSATYCPSCFSESRYFTRGWTLQELLAPKLTLFLDQTLTPIGTKADLLPAIFRATGVDVVYLASSPKELRRASVARRMSWASSRKTTRVEDNAYCLQGLFDVNMALLYGEGEKAFLRLQQHILANIPDDSLFA